MTNAPWEENGLDLELLAGYVEGTLTPGDQARAERLLASSPEAREVVAEAVRLREELEPPAAVTPVRALPRRATRWAVPLLAAAAVVALVLVPNLPRESTPGGPHLPPGVHAALPPFWTERPWGGTRSFRTELTPEATAFRLGTLWTDAVLSWEAGDGEGAWALLAPMAALLESTPGADEARALLEEAAARAAAGAPATEGGALLARADASLDTLLPAPYLAGGRWVEAVKLAALAGRMDLLGPRGPVGEGPVAAVTAFPAAAAREVASLRVLLAGGTLGPEDADPVLRHVVALQALLGT